MTLSSLVGVPMLWIMTNTLVGQYQCPGPRQLLWSDSINVLGHNIYSGQTVPMFWIIKNTLAGQYQYSRV